MRCTMKMYFSFFFFFLFLSSVFFLLFTFNTVNFDHTLSHRVNLLSIFFFKFFLFIIYITLAQSKRFSIFFERGVFFSFLYRTSDFYVALFEKTCIVFFFHRYFHTTILRVFFNMHTVLDWRTFGVYYICVFVQETEMSLTNYLNFCGHRK